MRRSHPETEVNICIFNHFVPSQEKPLRISGDPEKVEHAKQLVYELLCDKDMQGGGGGGGGQRQYDDYSPEQGNNGLATNSTEVFL